MWTKDVNQFGINARKVREKKREDASAITPSI
jgi:hypothetical protein